MLHHGQNVEHSALPQQPMIAHRQIAPIGVRFPLKPGCNFPLHMVNGLYLYRAVIPEARHGASHSPTRRAAPPPQLLAPHIYTNSVMGWVKKSIYLQKIPCHDSSLLHRWHFISVCLRPGRPVVPLFSSSSSCFCLPSTEFLCVLHICVILQYCLPLPPP